MKQAKSALCFFAKTNYVYYQKAQICYQKLSSAFYVAFVNQKPKVEFQQQKN